MSLLKTAAVLLLSMILLSKKAGAQPMSYIYIQGDKQTPFYVKLEGEMQPRYGKNYCILSQLLPGVTHLDILFQQNAFPAQRFTVNVGEHSSRSFLLTRQQDSFALYDIQQGFYLGNGNDAGDDKLPPARISAPVATVPAVAQSTDELPVKKPESFIKRLTRKPPPEAVAVPAKDTSSSGEHFINGIALNNEHTGNPVNFVADTASPDPENTAYTPVSSIRNSDCPAPLSKEAFGPVYKDALAAADDESRTAYMLSQLDKCYASWQARSLAGMLSTDAARFTVLKNLYPRISDQSAFALLDDLLRDASYKQAFNNLLHPKQ